MRRDTTAIDAFGRLLEGSGRPLIITSGNPGDRPGAGPADLLHDLEHGDYLGAGDSTARPVPVGSAGQAHSPG